MNTLKSFISRHWAGTFLFLSALFIRFPFFFRDYIDKDESTFILMGQSVADGHLPYDVLWDLKPPLLFYFFGLVEKLFPHSFIAIRFAGLIIVFFSAVLLMKIAERLQVRNAFLIALGYVVLSSEFGSLQGVMSEHFAVFFILGGVYIFLKNQGNTGLLLAGLAFGAAMLCKLSYAYGIAALVAVYSIGLLQEKKLAKALRPAVVMAAGILLAFIAVAIPYISAGKTDLFINSVFLAPMEYARALQLRWVDKLQNTWWVMLASAAFIYLALRLSSEQNKQTVLLAGAVTVGTVYTFYSSGIVNGHYLVLIYPFLLLLLGVMVPRPVRIKNGLLAAIVVLISVESIAEYASLFARSKDPEEYRPTFEVVSELKKRKLDDDKIFFADYHIGYWLLDQYPLTKSTTHPSNLARPFLFKYYKDNRKTSLQELKYIMEKVKPQVIVSKSDELEFFPDSSSENRYFEKSVSDKFTRVYEDTVDNIFIWERK